MERLVPWGRLCAVIEPRYPKGKRGRPPRRRRGIGRVGGWASPIGIERMLRIYFLQQWYALADEALEDALA
jgi:IS5 family transposase